MCARKDGLSLPETTKQIFDVSTFERRPFVGKLLVKHEESRRLILRTLANSKVTLRYIFVSYTSMVQE